MPGLQPSTLRHFEKLGTEDQALAYQLWILRDMMSHRSVSNVELAQVSGLALRTVRAVTGGTFRGLRRSTVDKVLDQLDRAMTTITDRRGGVPKVCCGKEGLVKTHLAIQDGLSAGRRVD